MKKALLAASAAALLLALGTGVWFFLRAREERLSDQLFKEMVQRGADPDAHDPPEVLSLIREHPGLANREFPSFVERPLHRAAKNLWPEVCRALLAAGADPNARDHAKLSPLYYATYSQQVDQNPKPAAVLIEGGADVNARDRDGETLLHVAASTGSMTRVRFLIEHGADLRARTESGLTPTMAAADAIKDKYVDEDVAAGKLRPGQTLVPMDEERREVYLYLREQEKKRHP